VPQNKKFAAKFSPEIQIILSSRIIKVGAELNINVCGIATTFVQMTIILITFVVSAALFTKPGFATMKDLKPF
jgi:hypothetical protein